MAIVVNEFNLPRVIQAIIDGEFPVENLHTFLEQVAVGIEQSTNLGCSVVFCPDGAYGLKIWERTPSPDHYEVERFLQFYDISARNQTLRSENHPLV